MIGRTLSHYQVLEKLGEGGMGVVYKAQDTQLNRQVALKALPPDTAADPERRARFLQEAQAASALNHPGIVTIHDVLKADEGDVIVMELVPGRSLDELIPRKGMPLGEALKLAIQMASALEAAHEASIVHRDFKPANVMVGEDGRVRILDFGLAKVSPIAPEEGSDSRATEAAPRTRDGQVLGTVSYMSPEQAEGRTVDARSDIFSFGAVLYEMVTGHRPFRGDSTVSALAALIKEDPEPLPVDVPHDLEKLIGKCLRKDPQRRMRHMDDVRVALEDLKEESDSGTLTRQVAVAASVAAGRPWRAIALAVVALIAVAAGIAWWTTGRSAKSLPPMREIPFTADPGMEIMGRFSPDGSTVVFTRLPSVGSRSSVPSQGSIEVKMIGAEGTHVLRTPGESPAFSPDGRWIAFDGRTATLGLSDEMPLFVIPHIGGPERKIATLNNFSSSGGVVAWTPDGEWLVSVDKESAADPYHLVLLSVQTGEKHRLTTPPAGIVGDGDPAVSPDGRTLAFARHTANRAGHIYLLPLGPDYRPAGEPRQLTRDVPDANGPVWMPDGREILFCSRQFHAASLWRMRTDGASPPTPLGLGGRGALWPDVDRTGTRLLYTKHTWDLNVWRMELLPSGLPASAPEAFIRSNLPDTNATFSPDGRWIAFASERSGAGEIWVSDAEGEKLHQLTSLEADAIWDSSPHWSPDGARIAFDADVDGNRDVYVVSAEGGAPQRLTTNPAAESVQGWSPDGRFIHFSSERDGESRSWRVPYDGGEGAVEEAPSVVTHTDGRYRYSAESTESGVAIRRQPLPGGRVETLVEDAGWSFAVTRNGIYFAVQDPKTFWASHIAFLDLSTRQVTKIVDLPPRSGSGWSVSLSPDEQTLLFTQCDQETSDLMLVENFR